MAVTYARYLQRSDCDFGVFARGHFGFLSLFKTMFRNQARRTGGRSRLWRGQIKVH